MHSINSPGKKIRTPFPVPYARSKLQEIFQNFNKCIKQSNNFLVRNHHVPLNMSVKGSRTYTQASSVTDYIPLGNSLLMINFKQFTPLFDK